MTPREAYLSSRVERRISARGSYSTPKQPASPRPLVWTLYARVGELLQKGMQGRRLLPAGYFLGGAGGSGAELRVSLISPLPSATPPWLIISDDMKPLQVVAAVRALAREDMLVTEAASAMCLAIGIFPESVVPYPFGPVQVGVGGGMGGMYVGPGAAEMRPAVVWMRPHAHAMRAGMAVFQRGSKEIKR